MLLATRVCGAGCGAGDCARSCRGAMPDAACGSGPDCASRGRVLLSCSPPPWLLAWARKSACFGVSAEVVWVRITSSVGITGAASSSVQPTPSSSMPCASSDSAKVALTRPFSPTPCGAGVCHRVDSHCTHAAIAIRRLRSRRTAGRGDVEAELRIQFADAGRAGDVDLGQVVADHVQADEQHAAPLHFRADLGRDPAVALAQRAAFAAAAGGEVAAEFVALRNARQAVVHRPRRRPAGCACRPA